MDLHQVKRRKHVETKPTTPVSLFESQNEHQKRLLFIFERHKFALDLSMLGSGKTFTSSYLVQQHRDRWPHVIVVCPLSVQSKWAQMKDKHGIPINHMISQQGLRSQKLKQPKHGLLSRRDYTIDMVNPGGLHEIIKVDKVDFSVTSQFQKYIEEGLLLIIDEVQNIKNVSGQFHACKALIQAIVQADPTNSSRVLLLSGSPIDRQEHALHMFRSLYIMRNEQIARTNLQTQNLEWVGLQEIQDFCYKLDPVATTNVARPHRVASDTGLVQQTQRLFQQVFKKHCSSAMVPPKISYKLYKHNAFQPLSADEAVIVQRGIDLLKTATFFNEAGGTVNLAHNGGAATMSGITRALQIIETGKIGLFARLALKALQKPNQKVVLAVNYIETIQDLKAMLEASGYSVQLLQGSMSHEQRQAALEAFQRPDSEFRVMIVNQSVASTGIDLDDKDGRFPRVCYVSPNFSTITAYQLGHRFHRMDTKSDAYVEFVYGKKSAHEVYVMSPTVELKVLNALASKGLVMKETTPEQVNAGILFPCDHPVKDVHEDLQCVNHQTSLVESSIKDLFVGSFRKHKNVPQHTRSPKNPPKIAPMATKSSI